MSNLAASLQHHFTDFKQQKESVVLGMWSFLVQEVMFFGGLFMTYAVFRSQYPLAFHDGATHLNTILGSVSETSAVCQFIRAAAERRWAFGRRIPGAGGRA